MLLTHSFSPLLPSARSYDDDGGAPNYYIRSAATFRAATLRRASRRNEASICVSRSDKRDQKIENTIPGELDLPVRSPPNNTANWGERDAKILSAESLRVAATE